jgi:hypothetical protein
MSMPVAINPITGSPTVFFLALWCRFLLTHITGVECDSRGGGGTGSLVNVRALVDFGPSLIFRRVTNPA